MTKFKSKYTDDKFTCKDIRDFFDQQYRYVNNLPLTVSREGLT